MEQLILFLALIVLGYVAGKTAESRHYRSIQERERKLLRLPAVTVKTLAAADAEIAYTRLVVGSVVISIDYFKRLLAGLRNIFGGRVMSYETLIDRARREAVLRMKERADNGKADIVLNLRIETTSISRSANRRKAIGSIEAIAYGTAVTYKK
ncbi:YbjQ family protein [Thermodesulfobacteriota bacterium]